MIFHDISNKSELMILVVHDALVDPELVICYNSLASP